MISPLAQEQIRNLELRVATEAEELERVLKLEFPQYKENREITIKISGCMNACGQHNMSSIGFQGMSINLKLVAPALQVLLGGGI
jgi:sulfite reductase (ferredoxin)